VSAGHKAAIVVIRCYPLALFRSAWFKRWQRHTLLQFLAYVSVGTNCKCVWLLALAISNQF